MILRAENIQKQYGSRMVVKGISLEVEQGQIVVIPAEKNLQKGHLQWFDGNVPVGVLTFCGVWFDGALSVNVSDFFVVDGHPVHIDLVVKRVVLRDNVGHATEKKVRAADVAVLVRWVTNLFGC